MKDVSKEDSKNPNLVHSPSALSFDTWLDQQVYRYAALYTEFGVDRKWFGHNLYDYRDYYWKICDNKLTLSKCINNILDSSIQYNTNCTVYHFIIGGGVYVKNEFTLAFTTHERAISYLLDDTKKFVCVF